MDGGGEGYTVHTKMTSHHQFYFPQDCALAPRSIKVIKDIRRCLPTIHSLIFSPSQDKTSYSMHLLVPSKALETAASSRTSLCVGINRGRPALSVGISGLQAPIYGGGYAGS